MAAQASIFTGTQPARHGVPGNQWFDRSAGRLIDYMSPGGLICVYGLTVLGGAGCAGGLANGHLLAPTIYEAAAQAGLTSAVYFSQYWKGAARAAPPTVAEMVGFLAGNPVDWRAFDSEMAGRAVADLKSRGLPPLHHASILREPMASRTRAESRARWRIFPVPSTRCWATFWIPSNRSTRRGARIPCSFWFRTMAAPTWCPIPKTSPSRPTCRPRFPPARPSRKTAAWRTSTSISPAWWTFRSWRRRGRCRLSSAVAAVRVRGAEDSPRDGDLILTLQPGHYFGNTGVGSDHGSVYNGDLNVPLLVAMPGGAGGHMDDPVSITQVARTIAGYLGFPMDSADAPLPVRRRGRSSRR